VESVRPLLRAFKMPLRSLLSVQIIVFVLLQCIIQSFSSGFYENNTNYNQEMVIIKNGKAFVQQQLKNESSRMELLCVTFMNGANPLSNRMLYVNMRRMGNDCDFAVILYAGRAIDVTACNRPPNGRVVHCDRAEITTSQVASMKILPFSNLITPFSRQSGIVGFTPILPL
jgi:hypothetical protein